MVGEASVVQSSLSQGLTEGESSFYFMATNPIPLPDVHLNVVFLTPIDFQKAYTIGLEIANNKKATFTGINLFTFAGPNPRETQMASFTANSSDINAIIEELTSKLGLSSSNIRVTILPMPIKPVTPSYQ
jgi:hypothetical protein